MPLNIKCSRKCASPDLPGVSSAAPTLYQIIWVTTGARWSGMTTSSKPFGKVKSATGAPIVSADAVPATKAAAITAAALMRSRIVQNCCDDMNFKSAAGGNRPIGSSRRRTYPRGATRIGSIATHRVIHVVVFPRLDRRRHLADAIGLVRRGRLIARRRFGECRARRLGDEALDFRLVFPEHPFE